MSDGALNRFGVVEWFRPGEFDRVEASLRRMREIGCSRLRTHISWAEFLNEGGRDWYDWLLPHLARNAEVLPCVHYTPPSLSETGRANGPPRELRRYADFVDELIERYGAHFSTIELWNEPNNLLDWDWRVDSDWVKFCTMVGAAAYWAQQRGRRVVLGGPCPNDLNWLNLVGERGLLSVVDVLGLHGFPGTWDSEEVIWPGWHDLVRSVRDVLDRHNESVGLWITETGYSSWRRDWRNQISRFLDVLDAPVEEVYWYALQDLADDVVVQEGHRFDERHYHLGLYDKCGRPKPLARLLESGGIQALKDAMGSRLASPALKLTKPLLVTGGAGFVGSNLANRLAEEGHSVVILDSFARPGVERNAAWLRKRHPTRVSVTLGDLRDQSALEEVCQDASAVFHLAAQVAVTSSLDDPVEDFDVNLKGTLKLLETLRRRNEATPLIFASTNKVYGNLSDVALIEETDAYRPSDPDYARWGIDETRPLAFSTPYGCSKGAAEQYVSDYAHSFGIPTAVLRMSCIYGPRQLGSEDQGWLAHFLISAMNGKAITIYGNGKQVRDVLYIDDAIAAYLQVWKRVGRLERRVHNLGGGPANALSLLQVLSFIQREINPDVPIDFHRWRPGDQRYYVSDIRRVRTDLALPMPRPWQEGVKCLVAWLQEEGIAAKTRGRISSPSLSFAGAK